MLNDQPARGELVAATQRTMNELTDFFVAKRLVDLLTRRRSSSRHSSIGLASMHASPPLETRPVPSMSYVADATAAWPAERRDAWLQKFKLSDAGDHFGAQSDAGALRRSLFMRRTPGKIHRIWIGLNPFPLTRGSSRA